MTRQQAITKLINAAAHLSQSYALTPQAKAAEDMLADRVQALIVECRANHEPFYYLAA